jgi:hypothetical protein
LPASRAFLQSGSPVMKKYSEEVTRYAALTAEGKPCEVLERVTYEHDVQADGTLAAGAVFNRRFDLRTGERLNRITDTEFADDESGAVIRLGQEP